MRRAGIGGVATLLIALRAGFELRRIRNARRAGFEAAADETAAGALATTESRAPGEELTATGSLVADPAIEAVDDALAAAIAAKAKGRPTSFSRSR